MGVKCAPAPTGAAIHLFFSYTLMLTSHSLLQQSLADLSDGWSGLWHVCMPFNGILSGSRLACHVLERVSLEMLRRQAGRFFSGSGTIHWTDPFLSLAWVHLNVALNWSSFVLPSWNSIMCAWEIRLLWCRSGGIQGGLSNGEDIVARIAFKPTSTISRKQNTVSRDGEEVELIARGRHDPCVVPRAVPMVEAMAALVVADQLLQARSLCMPSCTPY
jgi:hypothetical protein